MNKERLSKTIAVLIVNCLLPLIFLIFLFISLKDLLSSFYRREILKKMDLQKIDEIHFYDKEQKNSIGYYVLKLNDKDELEKVKNYYYDAYNDEMFKDED